MFRKLFSRIPSVSVVDLSRINQIYLSIYQSELVLKRELLFISRPIKSEKTSARKMARAISCANLQPQFALSSNLIILSFLPSLQPFPRFQHTTSPVNT